MSRRRPADLATRELRRERIEALLIENPDRSNAAIAAAAMSDTKTTARIRTELERAARIEPRTRLVPTGHGGALRPTVNGNTKAVQSGVGSETRLAPLRQRYLADLHARFPNEDGDDLRTAASRRARIKLREQQLDRERVGSKRWETAAADLSRLESAHERQLQRFRADAKERATGGLSLESVLAEIAGPNGDAA